MSNKSDREAWN